MGNFIPYSTSNQIIFRYDYWSKAFDINAYTPVLTGNRISVQELSQIITNIQNIQKPYTSKIRTALWVYLFLVVALFAFAIFLINTSLGEGPGGNWIILLVYFFIIFVLAAIYTSYSKKIRQQGQKQVQREIDRYNQSSITKGLRWSIPLQFPRWIELNVEFVVQQGVYMPPTNQSSLNYEAREEQSQQNVPNYYAGNQLGYNPQKN